VWLRMHWKDIRIVLYYTGLFVIGIGALMVIPLLTAILFTEWNPALDYLVGISAALVIGATLRFARIENPKVTHTHALALTAFGC